MVKVTVAADAVVLIKVPLILPLPTAASPVTAAVLFLVQLKVVEDTLPERTIVAIEVNEQIVCDEFVATTFGIGFT